MLNRLNNKIKYLNKPFKNLSKRNLRDCDFNKKTNL